MKNLTITKASGQQAPFETEKLRESLRRSHADEHTIDQIVNQVIEQLYEGISTRKIYQIAFSLLKKKTKGFAAKYKLRRAIMELGPSGFPFEKYVAEILKSQGYRVKLGQIMPGHCVNHEIDIMAEKADDLLIIECKFHNSQNYTCNVRIPLYIQGRFLDLEKNLDPHETRLKNKYQGWLITNTKFSSDAIKYSQCSGLHLLGWDFPAKNSLSKQVEAASLYPITCLTMLTQPEKQVLLNRMTVLCREIHDNPSLLSMSSISDARRIQILQEVDFLSRL